MGYGLIIPENLIALSGASVSSDSEASTSMSDQNLLTEEPSEFWRSTINDPTKTNSFLSPLRGALVTVVDPVIPIINHNLYRGDQFRVFLTDSPTTVTSPSDYSPVASIVDNCLGSYADIDNEWDTSVGSWITADSGETWSIILKFSVVRGDLPTKTNDCSFWLCVKSTGTPSQSGRNNPIVAAELQSGNIDDQDFRKDLGTKTITSTTGQWVWFSFSRADLDAAAVDDNVFLKLSFSSRYLLSAADTIAVLGHLRSVVLRTEALVGSVGADSGWLTYNPFVGSGINYAPEVQGQPAYAYVKFSGSFTFRQALVMFRSDRTPGDFNPLTENHPAIDGYVQVGCMMLGGAWSPATDRGHGPYIGTVDLSSKGVTDGGQTFGSRRPVLRTLSWPLIVLSKSEGNTILDRLLWRNGTLKKYFVHLNPGDSVEDTHGGFLATLKASENVMSTTAATEGNRSITLEFVEAL